MKTCLFLWSLLLLSGCASIRVAGEVQTGRHALLAGRPDEALSHFRRAADLNPDYLLNFSLLDEGIWTYVGRAYYAMGKLPEARQALERARWRYDEDHLAKLYLGLVLARDGERHRALTEIESGLTGLGDWLDNIDRYRLDGRFWDPGKRLRSEIQRNLSTIQGRDIDWAQLIASGEWLGTEFEREVDFAKRDKYLFEHDGGDSKSQ
ncbi:MAG: tetratricopeptide repeat protein [Deltaproteobacteria bacterium]|nr:tetratricopeptide repeat protein [Deltaproteobacteria bacterium]